MTTQNKEQGESYFSETLFANPPGPPPESTTAWWTNYKSYLNGLSETARGILEADCRYVVDSGIFGTGEPGPGRWPRSRVRRGLVMGSVQSGKTASMFGVAALALDNQTDLVIILAGTRLSLWSQTFSRFKAQLDVGPEGALKERRRLLVPRHEDVVTPEGRLPLSTLYNFEPAQVRRAIREKRPIIVVAMKHADHLRALGKSLRESVFPAAMAGDRPFHMLVLDDEADDGSILDALVEEGEDPLYGNLKQIPRAIADLWDPRLGVAPSNLYATYVAYTATPQANFLQQDHNPLAPKDFVASLRTAYDRGEAIPRETTYFEPSGLNSYYTGGEVFYRRCKRARLCVATSGDPTEDNASAVRAFLVASAIRQIRMANRLGPLSARDRTFSSREQAMTSCGPPRSMLIHPSAMVSDHFGVAVQLLSWAGQPDPQRARDDLSTGRAYLPNLLSESLKADPAPWQEWLYNYRYSAEKIADTFDLAQTPFIPGWAEVETVLRNEIIPGTRVSVVNSNPDADDRPEYEPWQDASGWHAAPDLSTIFVSGNVMSRGLTLEGLTTTLFLRHSNHPFADSQMQMQRWFGYRGPYIELCRVLAPQQQLDLFASYHEGDEALRQAVSVAMNETTGQAPAPYVLQGQDFIATGKIANLGNQPLCQGAKPFIRLINKGEHEDPNIKVVASLFAESQSANVSAAGRPRGRILLEPVSLEGAADIVDRLRFDDYRPGSQNWQGEMWAQVQARVESQGELRDRRPLYRPPEPAAGTAVSDVRKDCPYALSAYLRLWAACLTRHVRGLFTTESPLVRWSMVDLSDRAQQQPRFWVGIRYGSGQIINEEPISDLPFEIPAMERGVANGELVATWGSRDPEAGPDGYRGDEYFDYYYLQKPLPSLVPDEPPWRPVGSDGLILFHINQPPYQPHPTVTAGLCIPLGGPDQFAAVVSSANSTSAAQR